MLGWYSWGHLPEVLQDGDWYYDPLPSIGGPHGGVSEYVDGNDFWNGIREFACTVFPELCPTSAYAATMVRNLSPEQSATGPTGQHMSNAAVQVAEVLGQLIRPRFTSMPTKIDSCSMSTPSQSLALPCKMRAWLAHATVRALLRYGCGDPRYRTVYHDQGAYGLPHTDQCE